MVTFMLQKEHKEFLKNPIDSCAMRSKELYIQSPFSLMNQNKNYV